MGTRISADGNPATSREQLLLQVQQLVRPVLDRVYLEGFLTGIGAGLILLLIFLAAR